LSDAHARRAARAEGLRYVSDREPGLRRVRRGRGFRYEDAAGRAVTSPAVLARIRALAIPPAWTQVWICASARGHLQACGRDARGRKQYRYHAAWLAMRNETKFERMLAFGQALPRIRRRVEQDLAQPGLPRRKVLATVVRLLERSLIRVGCDEYARSNDAYGLATLRVRHVSVSGDRLHFRFRGKGGKQRAVAVRDPRAARVVRRCLALPGREVFRYAAPDGAARRIDSGDVNRYLREIAGGDFTAKDFRTWGASLLAVLALQGQPPPPTRAAQERAALRVVRFAAEQLGNTPAVCRRYYVNPRVFAAFADGALAAPVRRAADPAARLASAERALLALLRDGGGRARRAA
jgi:DNA topoisomerase-1